MASPRSTAIDLKGAFLAPTRALLGTRDPPGALERLEFVEGVEIDLTLNEAGTLVLGLIKGNGNMLERVLDPTPLIAGEGLAELRGLALRNLIGAVTPTIAGSRSASGRTSTCSSLGPSPSSTSCAPVSPEPICSRPVRSSRT